MGRSEALVHVSPQTCTKAVHAFREADHPLRNAAYVMPKVFRDDVEMATRFRGRVSHFLAERPKLSPQGPKLSPQGPKLFPQRPKLSPQGPELLPEGSQGPVKVSAGLGVHGATLTLGPRSFQACRIRYSVQATCGR